jgi:hypothetical protein
VITSFALDTRGAPARRLHRLDLVHVYFKNRSGQGDRGTGGPRVRAAAPRTDAFRMGTESSSTVAAAAAAAMAMATATARRKVVAERLITRRVVAVPVQQVLVQYHTASSSVRPAVPVRCQPAAARCATVRPRTRRLLRLCASCPVFAPGTFPVDLNLDSYFRAAVGWTKGTELSARGGGKLPS